MVVFFSFLASLLFFHGCLYASWQCDEKDLVASKNRPIISGVDDTSIISGKAAAVTVCTTPLSLGFLHVALAFELKHTQKSEIKLFMVHFGGDGYSELVYKDRPFIDSAADTLKKLRGGYEVNLIDPNKKYKKKPIYNKQVTFIIENKYAVKALSNIIKDKNIKYSLLGFRQAHNCSTYARKVLRDCGIKICEDSKLLVRPRTLVKYCYSYTPKERQRKKFFKINPAFYRYTETMELDIDLSSDYRLMLNNFTKLTTLKLRKTGKINLSNIKTLTRLTSLDLAENKIDLKDISNHFNKLKLLKTLNLGNNNITIKNSPVRLFSLSVNLTHLNLEKNRIREQGIRFVSRLTNLTSLNLNENSIGEGIKFFSGLTNLTELSLTNNYIQAAHMKTLYPLTKLTTLNFTKNQISDEEIKLLKFNLPKTAMSVQ